MIAAHTKINQGTSMEGEIISKNDIRLDGILNGKINTEKKIFIGKKGAFNGKLKCENLILEGSLQGEASVSNSTSLLATSIFNGVLSTHKFSVEEGAFFEGDCKTTIRDTPPDAAKVIEIVKEINSTEATQTSGQKTTIDNEI